MRVYSTPDFLFFCHVYTQEVLACVIKRSELNTAREMEHARKYSECARRVGGVGTVFKCIFRLGLPCTRIPRCQNANIAMTPTFIQFPHTKCPRRVHLIHCTRRVFAFRTDCVHVAHAHSRRPHTSSRCCSPAVRLQDALA